MFDDDKCYEKKNKQDKGNSEHEEVSAILFKAVSKAFSEKGDISVET